MILPLAANSEEQNNEGTNADVISENQENTTHVTVTESVQPKEAGELKFQNHNLVPVHCFSAFNQNWVNLVSQS